MRGKFVIVEGVDGAGKSTLIKEAFALLKEDKERNIHQSIGFSRDSHWDGFIHAHPDSLLYYLDLAWKTTTQIKPLLAEGITVVQDRYVQTVDSYLPDAEFLRNRIVRPLMNSLFLQPDVYFHITASAEEVQRRLASRVNEIYSYGQGDGYHAFLLKNPLEIVAREKRYQAIFEELSCQKHIIDTTRREAKDCAQGLVRILRRELPCL